MTPEAQLAKVYKLVKAALEPLRKLEELTRPPDAPKVDLVTISCDGSVKKNPGGPGGIGAVIRFPGKDEPVEVSMQTKAKSNNQSEFDAIYCGITTLLNGYMNRPGEVDIVSDSQLVIKSLNGEQTLKNEELKRKHSLIRELVDNADIQPNWVWKPRNSTLDLKRANNLAQDSIGVKNH